MLFYHKIFFFLLFQLFFKFAYLAVDHYSNHNNNEKIHQSMDKKETAKESFAKHESENMSKQCMFFIY